MPSPTSGILNGDFNGDGAVDIFDLNTLLANYGASGTHTYSQGDANYDQTVNIFDLNALLGNYGTSVKPYAGPGTPVVTSVDSSSIHIAWQPNADHNLGVFDVYRDSARIASQVTGASYTDTLSGSQLSQPHTYFVVSRAASTNDDGLSCGP